MAGEDPVPELVIHRSLALALGLELADDLGFALFCIHSVVLAGIDHDSRTGIGKFCFFLIPIASSDHPLNGNAVGFGKFEIPLVMSGHGHDRSGTVTDEDVIRHPYRNFFSVHRIEAVTSGKDAGFVFGEIGAVQVAFLAAAST